MKRVTGIDGIFFKADNPAKLYEWYKKTPGDQIGAGCRKSDWPGNPKVAPKEAFHSGATGGSCWNQPEMIRQSECQRKFLKMLARCFKPVSMCLCPKCGLTHASAKRSMICELRI
jgi:hypothetical protein